MNSIKEINNRFSLILSHSSAFLSRFFSLVIRQFDERSLDLKTGNKNFGWNVVRDEPVFRVSVCVVCIESRSGARPNPQLKSL